MLTVANKNQRVLVAVGQVIRGGAKEGRGPGELRVEDLRRRVRNERG